MQVTYFFYMEAINVIQGTKGVGAKTPNNYLDQT